MSTIRTETMHRLLGPLSFLAAASVAFSVAIVARSWTRATAEFQECNLAAGYWDKRQRTCQFPPAQCPRLNSGEPPARVANGWCEVTLAQLRSGLRSHREPALKLTDGGAAIDGGALR